MKSTHDRLQPENEAKKQPLSRKNMSSHFFFAPRESKQESHFHPIPKLMTLDTLANKFKEILGDKTLNNVAVIAVQHNLETTVSLYRSIKALGVRKIFTLGKCYSDSPEIVKVLEVEKDVYLLPSTKPCRPGDYHKVVQRDVDNLWRFCLKEIKDQDIDTIIILDDGGRCLIGTPAIVPHRYKMAGIEQTRGRLYHKELDRLPFSIVDVATSALKKYIEAPFIAKAVISTVDKVLRSYQLTQQNAVVGIIGKGVIGTALTQHLLSLKYMVNVYDEEEDAYVAGVTRMETIQGLVARSNCIFSCTGKDISQDITLADHVAQDTIFISCSSEDKEFHSELKKIAKKAKNIIEIDPLKSFTTYSNTDSHSRMIFVNGGYPVNFNKSPWNVPQHEIEPTQAALFSAVIQGVFLAKRVVADGVTISKNERVMLLPEMQRFIVEMWQDEEAAKQFNKELLAHFKETSWIQKNSGGAHQEIPTMAEYFYPSTKVSHIRSAL